MHVTSTLLKSDPTLRNVRLTPSPEAAVGKDRARRSVKAIYELAGASSEFYRNQTRLLLGDGVRGRPVGATLPMREQESRPALARNE